MRGWLSWQDTCTSHGIDVRVLAAFSPFIWFRENGKVNRSARHGREIGVRAALGALRGNILGLVVRQGLLLTASALAIGLAGAVAASSTIAAMLFGVSRLDPATYIGVTMILCGVSALACLVPAWRAIRVDPVTALRSE